MLDEDSRGTIEADDDLWEYLTDAEEARVVSRVGPPLGQLAAKDMEHQPIEERSDVEVELEDDAVFALDEAVKRRV